MRRWVSGLTLAILFIWGVPSRAAEPVSEAVGRLIVATGNATDEVERLSLLEKLSADLTATEALRKEAASLATAVGKWNSSSSGEYMRQMQPKGPRGVPEYDFQVTEDSPLRPIAELYRGRMLAWLLIQDSNVRGNRELAKRYKDEVLRSLAIAERAFPANPIPAMYRGEAIPWPKDYSSVAGAPRWAVLQREHLDRSRDVILWWIEHRQRADGSFGGGWGDDCEMWRWWSPVLLGFDDPRITAAQLRFSKAALARPHVTKHGFLDKITDVEHAAEDTTDNLVPLMVLEPSEQRWHDWTQRIVGIMDRVWTAKNERGGRQFRSFYFSASEVSPAPHRAQDVIANVAAVNPALLTWLKTRDPQLGRPLTEWLDAWVDATAREENGNPAGIVPASLNWPDGRVGGINGRWWEPVAPGGSMYGYYLWPSVITELTDAMLVAYLVTGEDKYLAPIRSMAAARLNYLKRPPETPAVPGSLAWCAAELGPRESANSNTGALVKTLARCQALTGTHEFDELIALEGPEYALSGSDAAVRAVETALEKSLATLRVNFPGFTSEVHGTDRVMRFVQFLAEDYQFDAYKGITLPKNELVYRMVTGDANAPRFPLPAVRWLTPPTDFGVLVTAASTRRFEAELFHFGDEPRPMQAEFGLLTPGRYHVQLLIEEPPSGDGQPMNRERPPLEVTSSSARLVFELPAQRRCQLRIVPL